MPTGLGSKTASSAGQGPLDLERRPEHRGRRFAGQGVLHAERRDLCRYERRRAHGAGAA